MKKLILISALLFSFNGWTQVTDDVHKKCKDVADYIGCVQIFSGANFTNNDNKADLERSLRLLPRRLENTVLRDFSNAIEPFIDALSIAEGDKRLADTELLSNSMKIEKALYIARKAWDDSIEADVAYESNLRSINSSIALMGSLGSSSLGSTSSDLSDVNTINKLTSCKYLNNAVHNFNIALGGLVMDYPCDIKQSCGDNLFVTKDVRQTIHSRMLLHIADTAKDASNSEVLDYPSIESIELTTPLDCENEKKRLAEEKAIKDRESRDELTEAMTKKEALNAIFTYLKDFEKDEIIPLLPEIIKKEELYSSRKADLFRTLMQHLESEDEEVVEEYLITLLEASKKSFAQAAADLAFRITKRDEEALKNQELWEKYGFIGDDVNDCKTFKMRISIPKTRVNTETAANFKRVCGEKEGEFFDWISGKEAQEMRKKAKERSR